MEEENQEQDPQPIKKVRRGRTYKKPQKSPLALKREKKREIRKQMFAALSDPANEQAFLNQDASKIEDQKLANYLLASQKYNDYMNNAPKVPSNASLGEKIANQFAVMKHNLMAPDNPNLVGGTVGNGLLGGGGLGKFALKVGSKLFDKYRNR